MAGRDRVGGGEYTPLYKNGIKKTQNNSMETTTPMITLDQRVMTILIKRASKIFHPKILAQKPK